MDSYYDTPRPASQGDIKSGQETGYYDSPRSSKSVKLLEADCYYDSPKSSPRTSQTVKETSGYYDTPRQHRAGGRLSPAGGGLSPAGGGLSPTQEVEGNLTPALEVKSELSSAQKVGAEVGGDVRPGLQVGGEVTSGLQVGYYDVPRASTLSLDYKSSSDGPSSKPGSSTGSLESENHFSVDNTDGGRDIYARPSFRLKPKTIIPPDLPPRNSPRQSKLVPLMDSSPDYVDVDQDEEVKVVEKKKEERFCERCKEALDDKTKLVNSAGCLYHASCFVCAQCFQPFKDGLFFSFEDRKYCEHDFQILFAPCCQKCSEFIVGRVIRALSGHWHPSCLTCDHCSQPVADTGFSKYNGRAVCSECSVKLRSAGRHLCRKCHTPIEGDPLRVRGELYHPHHFNCTSCGVELTSTAREVRTRPGVTANQLNELYCLRCHDKMNIPICGACRRPIEERVVTALGKHWHVEHFVCAKCEKPFLGHRHYERQGLAYCLAHYHQLFGNLCYVCDSVIQGDVFTALNKAWCVDHFSCSSCDRKMTAKTKFFEVDLKPVCKNCYEKYPRKSKLQLKKYHEMELLRHQRSLTNKNDKLASIFKS